MKRIKSILLGLAVLVCIFLGLWLTQDNPQLVEVKVLGFEVAPLPLGFWLIIALVSGVAVGMLASMPVIIRKGREAKALKQH